MSLFVTRCHLHVDTAEVTDFKAVSEKARVLRKQVHLMYGTGHAEITMRYQIEVDYVVPRDTTPFDFATVAGGTLDIEYDGQSQDNVRYSGVYCLDVGDAMIDGENELIKKITLGAEARNGNAGDAPNDVSAN